MANEKRLIDADALKKCTCEWCNTHYSDEPCEPSECIEMLRIDGQPTVDAVEVVHGRWVQMEFWTGGGTWRCSECGRQIMFMNGTPTTENMHYCPGCGADMRGTEE